METRKAWISVNEKAMEAIEDTGHYKIDKAYLHHKYEDNADIYLHIFDWYAGEASKIAPLPDGCHYPIVVSIDPKQKMSLKQGHVLLELNIPTKDLIVTDAAKWDYILNYWYLPLDEDDLRAYKTELKDRGIHNQALMYMGQFHPQLKQRVTDSWSRVFDNQNLMSDHQRVTVWEVRKEWIVSTSRPHKNLL